jgi:hypothetical protein
MMETILHILSKDTGGKPAKKAKGSQPSEGQTLCAREMAGKAIDRMADPTANPDDQASRKHRLLKGSEEFREARGDRLKVKGK